MTVDDQELDWRLTPKYTQKNRGLRINSLGFRGAEFQSEKKDSVVRILAVGDSCTFGTADIPDSDTYPYVLGNLLNAPLKTARYEVINAGVPGYTSRQCLRYFKSRLVKYRPDIIIMYCGWNDIWTYRNPASNTAASPVLRNISRLMSKSLLFSLLRDYAINPLRFKVMPARSGGVSGVRSVDPAMRQLMSTSFDRNIRDMIATASANGMRSILFTLPMPVSEQYPLHPRWQEGYPGLRDLQKDLNGIIRSVAGSDAAVFDCENVMSAYGPAERDRFFADAVHLNPEGNRAVAEKLVPIISFVDRREH